MIAVSFVLLVGLAATAILRRQSAALRHWVLASAIACASAIPALQLVAPKWSVPIALPWTERQIEVATFGAVSSNGSGVGVTTRAPVATGQRRSRILSLQAVWLAGSILSLTLLLTGFARLNTLARRSRRVTRGPWADTLAAVSGNAATRRTRLLQSDHPTLLVTWGITRPNVILPAAAVDWPADRVRVVLLHELAHVRRGDWPVQIGAEIVRCFYWFNPLIWLACRQLRQQSELACDDAVLNGGVDAPDYAMHLVDVARTFGQARGRRWLLPAPAMARPSHLERRVRAMLNRTANRTPVSRVSGAVTVAAFLVVGLPIAGLVASAEHPPRVTILTTAVGQDEDRRVTAAPTMVAQELSADFSGSLLDATGRAIPNVPIALVNRTTGERRDGRTDDSGHVAMTGLAAGEYDLEMQKPGFRRAVARLEIASGQHLQQDMVAQIGSLTETIHIQGTAGVSPAPLAPSRVTPSVATTGSALPPDPCNQSAVGGCLTPPMKLVHVNPFFPAAHARDGASGTIIVDGRIGADGFVKDLQVREGGDPEFAAATLEAVRQWRFSPVRLNGIPQECAISVTARFDAAKN